jgi:hypothetical protein
MIIRIKNCLNCNVPHEWDFEGPTLKEYRTIKKLTGWDGEAYAEHSAKADPDALAAMLYILHQRDKIKVSFDDVDLNFNDFDMIETEDERKARETMEAEQALAEKQGKKGSPKG